MISFNECMKSQVLYTTHGFSAFCGKSIEGVLKMLRDGAVDVYYDARRDILVPVIEVKTNIPTSGVAL